jgi:uncharacterized protein (TIGR02246 family)
MTDQQTVTGLLDTFAQGWNAASGATLASAFAADADFINVMGLHARGREVIAQGHDELLATVFRGTRMTPQIDAIRFLRPDVATVEATLRLQTADGQPFMGMASGSKAGFVATKENGAWSIAVFRNMIPFVRPAAGSVERSLGAHA